MSITIPPSFEKKLSALLGCPIDAEVDITRCVCGAVTIRHRATQICVDTENLKALTGIWVTGCNWSRCNSCGNNWSVERCACGSSKHFVDCCGKPYYPVSDAIRRRLVDLYNGVDS